MSEPAVVSAEKDLAGFLSGVRLMDLEPERFTVSHEVAKTRRYDENTQWWRDRAARSLSMEAGLRSAPEFTDMELRVARRVEERRAMARKYEQELAETRAS